MASDSNDTIWKLEPHTKAKHDLLRKYLNAWFPVLAKHRGRVLFLDGFAGPGVYADGEPGSPCIALETLLGHSYLPQMSHCEFLFVFNEQDPGRFASLEESIADIKARHGGLPNNVKVELVGGTFSDLAEGILEGLGDKGLAPTFAFLDPFGYADVPMELIRRLLSWKQCELFIYFDYNSANRFATSNQVDTLFEALYATDEFKQAPPSGNPSRGVFLKNLYERQLSEVCGFKHVQSFRMINKRNITSNYLFFCTRSMLGLKKMKEVMWKVDPTGAYKFSDRFAGEEVLFTEDVNTKPLQNELARVYAGRTVPYEDLEDYTVANTPFCASHLKVKTLKVMQRAGRISSPNQRISGTFPVGTLVQFPA